MPDQQFEYTAIVARIAMDIALRAFVASAHAGGVNAQDVEDLEAAISEHLDPHPNASPEQVELAEKVRATFEKSLLPLLAEIRSDIAQRDVE